MMSACAKRTKVNGRTDGQANVSLQVLDTEYKIQSGSDEQQKKKNARHIDDWNNNDVIAWLKINYVREINNGRASEWTSGKRTWLQTPKLFFN